MKYMQTEVTEGTPEMSKRLYPCYVVVCRQYNPPQEKVISCVCDNIEEAVDSILLDMDNRVFQDKKDRLPLADVFALRARLREEYQLGDRTFFWRDFPEIKDYGHPLEYGIHSVYLPGTLIQRILDSDEPVEHTTNNEPQNKKTRKKQCQANQPMKRPKNRPKKNSKVL